MSDGTFFVYVISMAVVCVYLLWTGARGLFRPRPFLISTRDTIIIIIPILVVTAIIFLSVLPLMGLFWIVMSVFICYSLLDQARGYAVLGVTSESFRLAIHSACHKLNLPFQETMGRVHLTSLDADLSVGVQDSLGAGFIRMKQKGFEDTANDIAGAMADYFASDSAPMVKTSLYAYLIFGILLLAVVANQVATRGSLLTGR